MPHLTIYLTADAEQRVRKAAKVAKVSVLIVVVHIAVTIPIKHKGSLALPLQHCGNELCLNVALARATFLREMCILARMRGRSASISPFWPIVRGGRRGMHL